MYRFRECKYSFELTFLWKKLEFYTRVHEKMYLVALQILKSETFIYDLITIEQQRTLLSIFFTKQHFFLNSNPRYGYKFFFFFTNPLLQVRNTFYQGSQLLTLTFTLDHVFSSTLPLQSTIICFSYIARWCIFVVRN